MLATRKMKKMKTCALCLRLALARSIGRIISIDAPVVPIHDASAVPTTSISVLSAGVPTSVPRSRIPPETV